MQSGRSLKMESQALTPQRRTAEAVVAAFNKMDVDTIISHRNETCTRILLPSSMNLQPQDNATYYSSMKNLAAIFHNFSLTITDLIEDKEARQICMHLNARADTVAGEYVNEYMWLLEFDSMGKISSSKEFSDSVMEREFYPKLRDAMIRHKQQQGEQNGNGL